MSDTLREICGVKHTHVEKCKAAMPLEVLQKAIGLQTPPRGFLKALQTRIAAGGIGLIAEIKKASPSKGLIREDFQPDELARAYAEGGASCLSVLTDTPYFQGKDEYLMEARHAVTLPVLRKDFMLDSYQVFEARALGADCILLIMAALRDDEAKMLEAEAMALGMDVLIEVHDEAEMERALRLDSKLLGINNRSLKTLEVDLATSEALCRMVPEGYTLICESGIKTHDDITRMRASGMHGFLVGESLMLQSDVAAATRVLLGGKA